MQNKIKNILFRVDSSSTIGTGHVMRDLVLVKQYPKANITFATQDLDCNINQKTVGAGYKVEILQNNDIKELDKLIKKLNVDLLVIDHYEIDYKQEKELKIKNPTLNILSFDDTYEKHYCDILLNHNISADKKKYKGLVPKDCELRCGTKYTLLRDEFIKEKKKIQAKKQFKIQNSKFKIFLAMGGADHSNLNIKILKVLKDFKNIKTIVVTTYANRNIDALKKYVKGKENIALHINSNKIAKLMKKSDFAIISASVTANEVHFMGLPFIAIKTAENQDDIYRYLKKKKYLVLEKFSHNKLKTRIFKILKKIG